MKAVLAALAPLAAQQAAPADMTAAEFLGHAVAAQRVAPGLAELTSDVDRIKAEMIRPGRAYRAEVDAAKAAGTPPRSFEFDDLIAEVAKATEAERATTSIRPIFYTILDGRFACS